jgi:hypothetical protein
MMHKDTSWENATKSTDMTPPYSEEIEKGTFSPDSDRLNSSPFFTPFMNENIMSNLDYDMREVKSRLDVFHSDNSDLKAEIKISNANTKHIMDDINKLTHSTETNASNITDIKTTFSEFKSETNLNFANITNEFSKVRTETKSEFEKVRTETASQFVDVKNEIALNFEKTTGMISGVKNDFSDKLRNHLYSTIALAIAVVLAINGFTYVDKSDEVKRLTALEESFKTLNTKVDDSTASINKKLDILIAQVNAKSKITDTTNKSVRLTKENSKANVEYKLASQTN